jgi:hypothetical protein
MQALEVAMKKNNIQLDTSSSSTSSKPHVVFAVAC